MDQHAWKTPRGGDVGAGDGDDGDWTLAVASSRRAIGLCAPGLQVTSRITCCSRPRLPTSTNCEWRSVRGVSLAHDGGSLHSPPRGSSRASRRLGLGHESHQVLVRQVSPPTHVPDPSVVLGHRSQQQTPSSSAPSHRFLLRRCLEREPRYARQEEHRLRPSPSHGGLDWMPPVTSHEQRLLWHCSPAACSRKPLPRRRAARSHCCASAKSTRMPIALRVCWAGTTFCRATVRTLLARPSVGALDPQLPILVSTSQQPVNEAPALTSLPEARAPGPSHLWPASWPYAAGYEYMNGVCSPFQTRGTASLVIGELSTSLFPGLFACSSTGLDNFCDAGALGTSMYVHNYFVRTRSTEYKVRIHTILKSCYP